MHHHPRLCGHASSPTGLGTRPAPCSEDVDQRVVQPLVVGHVAERIGGGRRLPFLAFSFLGFSFLALSLCRDPSDQQRLGRRVVVSGERDPDRPPRIVEAQRPVLELPGRRPEPPPPVPPHRLRMSPPTPQRPLLRPLPPLAPCARSPTRVPVAHSNGWTPPVARHRWKARPPPPKAPRGPGRALPKPVPRPGRATTRG